LAARAVQRHHQLAPELLAQRLLGQRHLDERHQLVRLAHRQPSLIQLDDGRQSQLGESCQIALAQRVVEQVGQRVPPPETQSRDQLALSAVGVVRFQRTASGAHELLEAVGIDIFGRHPEDVAVTHEAEHLLGIDDPRDLEVAAETRHMHLHALAGRRWHPISPKRLEELVAGNGSLRSQCQRGEHGPLLRR